MADFEDILPFGVGHFQAQAAFEPADFHYWRSASAFHFLRLLKLLGVEQQSIAAHLNATVSSVSMWVNGHRGTPAKFRAPLRAYAWVCLTHYLERLHKDKAALPPAQAQALEEEFFTRLRRWGLEIERDLGILHATVQAECHEIGTYAAHPTLTAADRRTLRYLCQSLDRQLATLEQLESDPEAT